MRKEFNNILVYISIDGDLRNIIGLSNGRYDIYGGFNILGVDEMIKCD